MFLRERVKPSLRFVIKYLACLYTLRSDYFCSCSLAGDADGATIVATHEGHVLAGSRESPEAPLPHT